MALAPLFRQRLQPAWQALLVLLLVAITYLALIPKPPEGMTTGWDKSNHLFAFGSLAFVGVQARWREPRRWGALLLLLLAYGIGIELAQHFLPPRSADWQDVVADMVGALAGLGVAALARRWVSER